jgi:catechol 2,3-dioxygenase-like lactoylglutathione lyase family enzyme
VTLEQDHLSDRDAGNGPAERPRHGVRNRTAAGSQAVPRTVCRMTNTTQAAVRGFNHLAILTTDLPRLVASYCDVFAGDAVDVPPQPGARRASAIRFGTHAALVVLEVDDHEHADGHGEPLRRGHLDHVGFDVPTAAALEEIRERLVDRGASDGHIHDYGSLVTVHFTDPDGMSSEICWLRDPELRDLHPPVAVNGPLAAPTRERA